MMYVPFVEMKEDAMKNRAGLTLVEVLVSIFLMGIGLLALLTLFPIGILTMAQAIRDDRTASAASNAAAAAQSLRIRHDPLLTTQNPVDLFTNPNPGAGTFVNAPLNGPSYALYVDPIGIGNFVGPPQQWVAGQPTGIRRTTLSFAVNNQLIWRWFTSMDDLVFDMEGKPQQITPGVPVFERKRSYSWAYLLRRPMNGKPSVVEMTVVVYDDRPTTMKNSTQAGETLYPAIFNALGSGRDNIVTVAWAAGQLPPNLSLGGWILDTTPVPIPKTKTFGPSHARFYQVVGIAQTSATTADLELQTPVVGFPRGGTGTIVVLDGVSQVYEMGAGWRP